MIKKNLKIFIPAAVILVLILAYFWFSSGSANPDSSSAPVVSLEQLSQAQEVLGVLALLSSIKLDTEFFNNPAFLSLYSFAVELPAPELGRINPFATTTTTTAKTNR